jgi:hypothetical protein
LAARPTSFYEELLPTSPAEVPADLGDAVAALCSTAEQVRAAYVCRVRREDEARSCSKELMSTAVEPVVALGEHDRAHHHVTYELMMGLPESLRAGGLSWLTESGAAAWREYGVCVFERRSAPG